MTQISELEAQVDTLIQMMKASKKSTVFTGAGISANARGPGYRTDIATDTKS